MAGVLAAVADTVASCAVLIALICAADVAACVICVTARVAICVRELASGTLLVAVANTRVAATVLVRLDSAAGSPLAVFIALALLSATGERVTSGNGVLDTLSTTAVGCSTDEGSPARLSVSTIPKDSDSTNTPIATNATNNSLPVLRCGMWHLLYLGRIENVSERQNQLERTTATRCALQPDAPAVHFGQRTRDRQTDTRIT